MSQITAVTSGGGGGGSLNTLTGNTGGPISPTAGNINISGGEMLNTVGSGSTVTVNMDRGTNGQIPIAATGAATQYANITSPSGTITITNSANAVNLEFGYGGCIYTIFNSSGTWNRNENTTWFTVIGWDSGAGGGSGRRGIAEAAGGGSGGASGGTFYYSGPILPFSSLAVPITIGAGGSGGAAVTTNNTNGNDGGANGFSFLDGFGSYKPADVAPLMVGKGGINGGVDGGQYKGPLTTYGVNTSISQLDPTNLVAGDGSTSSGSQGGVIIPNSLFSGTGGGGGGGASSTFINTGGNGADISDMSGVFDVYGLGGQGGDPSGTINGSPGNDPLTLNPHGMTFGGTGGGGGGGEYSPTAAVAGIGGAGAVPGGGGGGGGGSLNGTTSGAGGAGGDGMIIIFEFI